MASLLGLESYDSDSGEEDVRKESSSSPSPSTTTPVIDEKRKSEYTAHLKPLKRPIIVGSDFSGTSTMKTGSGLTVCANPTVEIAAAISDLVPIAPDAKEVEHNPTCEELVTPIVGPENPLKTQQAKADKNTAAGE